MWPGRQMGDLDRAYFLPNEKSPGPPFATADFSISATQKDPTRRLRDSTMRQIPPRDSIANPVSEIHRRAWAGPGGRNRKACRAHTAGLVPVLRQRPQCDKAAANNRGQNPASRLAKGASAAVAPPAPIRQ